MFHGRLPRASTEQAECRHVGIYWSGMPVAAAVDDSPSIPWYRTLNRVQWNTLIASNLGWLFDGFETYGLVLTVGVAMRQLLPPALYPQRSEERRVGKECRSR